MILATSCRPDWARYRIDPGNHHATVDAANDGRVPLAGFSNASGRRYTFVFDESAIYELTAPVQPDDQLDWNKLPGLSDCGTLDLAHHGAMFAWRWRPDLDPPRLEVTAYANADRVHQTPAQPLFSLTAAELATQPEMTYWFVLDRNRYRFLVSGDVDGRTVVATAELPRACASTAPDVFKWASGLYFGGTSTAPRTVQGWIREDP